MGTPMRSSLIDPAAIPPPDLGGKVRNWRDFPYWLLGMAAIFGWIGYLIYTQSRYERPYEVIREGLSTTIYATAYAFAFALILGLIAALGRISRNVVARNIATFYIEFIRGVPMLVLIFTIAYAVVPPAADLLGFDNSSVTFFWRAVIALALIYGAYLAEVFRAGIESVPRGQVEAGRSLGMSHFQTLTRITIPQAIRTVTPAVGNDLIAMLKDTSLISVLGVREMTRRGNSYAAQSFEYRPTYVVLTMFYLALTLALSLLLSWYRRRLGVESRG